MIRNLLYSLFIHFILFLLIYIGFNLSKIQEDKGNEVSVSVITINETEKPNDTAQPKIEEPVQEEPKPKEAPKEEIKKPELVEEVKKIPPKPTEEPKLKKKENSKAPRTAEKKSDDLDLEKLVEKSLEKAPEKTVEQAPKEETPPPPAPAPKPQKYYINGNAAQIEKTLELAGLSTREKFNLQSQIKGCYNRATKRTGLKSKVAIFVTINVNLDGSLATNLADVIDQELYRSEPNYKVAVDNAKLAIEICNPLRNLPREKYEIWKQITFEFKESESITNQ